MQEGSQQVGDTWNPSVFALLWGTGTRKPSLRSSVFWAAPLPVCSFESEDVGIRMLSPTQNDIAIGAGVAWSVSWNSWFAFSTRFYLCQSSVFHSFVTHLIYSDFTGLTRLHWLTTFSMSSKFCLSCELLAYIWSVVVSVSFHYWDKTRVKHNLKQKGIVEAHVSVYDLLRPREKHPGGGRGKWICS